MKLYELPRNTQFTLNGVKYVLDHIDGMYSVCFNERNELIDIAAFAEVETGK